jgi:eukaryotic translation initiation factor 2C
MDPLASRYMASIRVQASRVEMIEDIASMFDVHATVLDACDFGWRAILQSALQSFNKMNKNSLPKRIIFFRDGVSEGEFAIVRQKELSAMTGTFSRSLTIILSLIFVI